VVFGGFVQGQQASSGQKKTQAAACVEEVQIQPSDAQRLRLSLK
jgi:hypothetical protein